MSALITGLLAVAPPALKLIAGAMDKKDNADAINKYVDRAVIFDRLFDKDEKEAEKALTDLYSEIVKTLAGKGITASPWWLDKNEATGEERGAPCLRIPIATVRELLDAATR